MKVLVTGAKERSKLLHKQAYLKEKGRQCQVKQILLVSEYHKEVKHLYLASWRKQSSFQRHTNHKHQELNKYAMVLNNRTDTRIYKT